MNKWIVDEERRWNTSRTPKLNWSSITYQEYHETYYLVMNDKSLVTF